MSEIVQVQPLTLSVRKTEIPWTPGSWREVDSVFINWELLLGDKVLYSFIEGKYTDNSGQGRLEAPEWDEAGRVHEWRNYIDDDLKHAWSELDNLTRLLLRWKAEEQASAEEWD